MTVSIRPRWLTDVDLVRTGPQRVHVAADPELTSVLDGIDEPMVSWLRQVDGKRSWSQQIDEARARGISAETASSLLTSLWNSRLLVDAELTAPPRFSVIGAAATAAALIGASPQSVHLGTTPRPVQKVDWEQLLSRTDELAHEASQAQADLVVLALERTSPDSSELGLADRLVSAGIDHCVIGVGERWVRIGPHVVVDETACLRCEYSLLKRANSAWESITTGLALSVPEAPAAQVRALAAAELIRRLAGLELSGTVLEFAYKGGAVRRRTLVRDNSCGCWRA